MAIPDPLHPTTSTVPDSATLGQSSPGPALPPTEQWPSAAAAKEGSSPAPPPDQDLASLETMAEGPRDLRFGRYRVIQKLGSGGFGVVYKGFDDDLLREVAIKVAYPGRMTSANEVDIYLAEGRTLAGLDHPSIVPIYDVGRTSDGLCYLVSRLIPGHDLATRIRQGKVPPAETAGLIAAVAEALHHAHQRGLVHRDVKPANILITPDGRPVVTDFGLALHEEDFGKGPTCAGTPAYMSPEQARREGHVVDARTDVYSLGVVLYELLTGQRPFQASDRSALFALITNCEPQPPSQVDHTIPRELDRICLRALSKRASDRYSTASDLAEDLRHWLATQQGQVGERSLPPPLPAPTAPVLTPESDVDAAGVVPRGLRSFDREDADFFLRLLPGPRDREGLPESIRFWKLRLDEMDPDRTFRVGLLYGPSGCGKSSLVRAGLLPRLAGHVLPVYAEATPDDTEAHLLRGLRRHWPDLPSDLALSETLARLRRGDGPPAGQKVVLVLDQFEQWLHARQGEPDAELVQALRQCDGRRLQTLILVRDDFWMSVTRFMRDLEVPLLEGRNSVAVDLFTLRHAAKVLALFGRAFGALPAGGLEPKQKQFLERAVAGLAQRGRVMPVQLALFAEMVKGKPWYPATLREVGGVQGIGVTFLEEMFSAPTAPPGHRLHQEAARAVLRALLPEPGSDLKGQRRSSGDLLEVSGYAQSSADFAALLHILDAELRLVTPTDRPATDTAGQAPTTSEVPERHGGRSLQLSHDFLIEPLRHWLTSKQRETRTGRAQLRLAERAALWASRPETRQLPSWLEWAKILIWTRRSSRAGHEQTMMVAATRYHTLRGLLFATLLFVVAVAGLSLWSHLKEGRRISQAEELVARLLVADIDQVPAILTSLDGYSAWTASELARVAASPDASPRQRLRARLGLLPMDEGQIPPLFEDLLGAEPDDFLVLCRRLEPHGRGLIEPLWRVLLGQDDPARKLRAAAALAAFAPEDGRWKDAARAVAEQFVKQSPLHLRQWLTALDGARKHLLPPLAAIFRAQDHDPAERALATSALIHYAADQPAVLIDLVKDADARQYAQLIGKLEPFRADTVAGMTRELAGPVADLPDRQARRKANAAVTLLRMGEPEAVWPLLRYSPDPTVRSYLIHFLKPLGADPAPLVERLPLEAEVSARRAVLLCLGEVGDQMPQGVRDRVLEQALAAFREDPDAGVHSAAEWLLRTRGATDALRKAEVQLQQSCPAAAAPGGRRSWYIDRQGHTLAVIDGPSYSPQLSGGKKVERCFAVATKEVTVEQFLRFRRDHPYQGESGLGLDLDRPVNIVSWYDAAAYCRWLSEQEGVPEDQMCYPPLDQIQSGMSLYPDYLRRTGYRLPTEAEWELASRGGTWTSRFCGASDAVLPHYGWFAGNSGYRLHPVGWLKPNDFGLFDTLGNAMEWCQDSAQPGKNTDDMEEAKVVRDDVWRVTRGGSHHQRVSQLHVSQRDPLAPNTAWYSLAFRVARTHRPGR